MTDTRQNLIRVAMELFATKGYGSTSIADILQAADARSGSLYYFFPGKQDLLLAVLQTYENGIHEMLLEPAWRDIDDPIDQVFALLGFYRLALSRTECTYGCPIGNLALEIQEPDPPVREHLQANFDAWVRAVEGRFREATHRFPPGTDCRRLATFTLVTMEGGVMLSRTARSLEPFDDAIGQLRTHIETLMNAATNPTNDPPTENEQ